MSNYVNLNIISFLQGKSVELIDQAIQKCVQDILDRPGIRKSREVVFKFKMTPHPDHINLVGLDTETVVKVPSEITAPVMAVIKDENIKINLDDLMQGEIDFLQPEDFEKKQDAPASDEMKEVEVKQESESEDV